MLGILAFLYTHAPTRLCNVYLLDDQRLLGERFLYLALALAVIWALPLFSAERSVCARRRAVSQGGSHGAPRRSLAPHRDATASPRIRAW
jgi:hypothetical protein